MSVDTRANFKAALDLHQRGKTVEAEKLYDAILQQEPDHFDALHLLGMIALQTNRTQQGVALITKAISLDPNIAAAHINLGKGLHDLKLYGESLASYDRAILLDPDFAMAHNNRGLVLRELKRHEAALMSFDKALALNPDFTDAYNNRGNVLLDLSHYQEALESFQKAVILAPNFVIAYNNLGLVLERLKRDDEALANFDKALALSPDFVTAYNNRANLLLRLKRYDEALASYERATALEPNLAEAHYGLGTTLLGLKHHSDALRSLRKAIVLRPDFAEAYNNSGNVLLGLNRHEEALSSFEKAIELRPDFSVAYSNRGIALIDLKRHEEALSNFETSIALNPHYAGAYNNRGIALTELKRYEEALASLELAISLMPEYAEAYNNQGIVLTAVKRHAEAAVSFRKAISLKPDYEFVLGKLTHAHMTVCDWSALEQEIPNIIERIELGERVIEPFPLLALSDSPELQKKVAIQWAARHVRETISPINGKYARHDKIRVGYFSADFFGHPTAYLVAGMLEKHDRRRFELTAFSFTPYEGDTMQQRLRAAFDRFIDVQKWSDQDIAMTARKIEIDIAVDLKGFTTDSRTNIFAMRAAPMQVNYLGFPGTMGADYIDYLIADQTLIPASHRAHYSERIVYLPHTYQANDSRRFISPRMFTRSELGLPESGFIYCCFNNNFKITPDIFECWMRILRRVDGSVLWLLENTKEAADNLRREAAVRGLPPDRLVFANRIAMEEHLARHRVADLFLDTLPYNAHTTASDALWTGLPILTRIGDSFAGRVTASLLNTVDLSELITRTLQDYESLAIELGTQPAKLTYIRNKLGSNRLTGPLFDTDDFTKHIEAAYVAMYERYQANLPPDDVYII